MLMRKLVSCHVCCMHAHGPETPARAVHAPRAAPSQPALGHRRTRARNTSTRGACTALGLDEASGARESNPAAYRTHPFVVVSINPNSQAGLAPPARAGQRAVRMSGTSRRGAVGSRRCILGTQGNVRCMQVPESIARFITCLVRMHLAYLLLEGFFDLSLRGAVRKAQRF